MDTPDDRAHARFERADYLPFNPGDIANYEAKEAVGRRMAERAHPGQRIGAGSGTTSFLILRAIAARYGSGDLAGVTIVPTSLEIELAATTLGLPVSPLVAGPPDWLFDGADEVDPRGDLIKGRGGALFREKLLFSTCPERRIAVDASKLVDRLGRTFPIPVEVVPAALPHALAAVRDLGATEATIRSGGSKDGPTVTELGNCLLDCRFAEVAASLERELKSITGVVESGLFQGYGVEVDVV